MIEYFKKIEVIKGEATVNSKTKLELCDINDNIKEVDDDSEYADIKLAQIHLGKAISIIEDGIKKRDYQLKLESNFMMDFGEDVYPSDLYHRMGEIFTIKIEVDKFVQTIKGIAHRLRQ